MKENTNDTNKNTIKSGPLVMTQLRGEIPTSCIRPGCSGKVTKKGYAAHERHECRVCKTEYVPLDTPKTKPYFAIIVHPAWISELFPDEGITKFKKAVIRREAQRLVIDIKNVQNIISRLVVIGMGGVLAGLLSATFLVPETLSRNLQLVGGIAVTISLCIGVTVIIKNNELDKLRREYSKILDKKWIQGNEAIYEMLLKYNKETMEK